MKAIAFMRLRVITNPEDLLDIYKPSELVVQQKHDGHKVMAARTRGGVRLYSRRGVDITKRVPSIVERLKKILRVGDTVLGEMVYTENGRQSLEKVQSILHSSKPGLAAAKLRRMPGKLDFLVYDMLTRRGKGISDQPLTSRRKSLEVIIPARGTIRRVKNYTWGKMKEAVRDSLKKGGEGAVIKVKSAPYKYRKKGASEPWGLWWKYKVTRHKTSDVILTKEYRRGKEKLIFAAYQIDPKGRIIEVGRLSGLDKRTEREVKKLVDSGKEVVAEVSHQGRRPSGKLRDMGWVRLRPDKPAHSATMEMIAKPSRKKNPPTPANKILYAQVTAEAKKKFDVWPSIYASSWVVQEYKRRGGRYLNPLTGLDKWYAEKWVDLGRSIDSKGRVKKWVECGRPKAGEGAYPKCVPLEKAKKMTPAERLSAVRRKRLKESSAPKKKGRAPIMVKTRKKNGTMSSSMANPRKKVSRKKGSKKKSSVTLKGPSLPAKPWSVYLVAESPNRIMLYSFRSDEHIVPGAAAYERMLMLKSKTGRGEAWEVENEGYKVYTEKELAKRLRKVRGAKIVPGKEHRLPNPRRSLVKEALEAEATKHDKFEPFSEAYWNECSRGIYWIATNERDFEIGEPEKRLARNGRFFVACNPELALSGKNEDKKYVAELNVNLLPARSIRSKRGAASTEIKIAENLGKVRVMRTMSAAKAKRAFKYQQGILPSSKEQLRKFWEMAWKKLREKQRKQQEKLARKREREAARERRMAEDEAKAARKRKRESEKKRKAAKKKREARGKKAQVERERREARKKKSRKKNPGRSHTVPVRMVSRTVNNPGS